MDVLFVHSLVLIAAVYLGWWAFAARRSAKGCGSCSACAPPRESPDAPVELRIRGRRDKSLSR